MAMEDIHSHSYALQLDTFIKDEEEKVKAFNAIEEYPAVKKKAQWALQFSEDSSLAEQLVAFILVEGLFFSGSFCSIFWLKSRNLMPGFSEYNSLISRDECYVKGTEVLTPKGWRNIEDIVEGEEVIGFKDGKSSVESVQRTVNKEYNGDVITFSNESHKTTVTPNHDMIIYNFSTKEFQKVKAKDLKPNHTKALPHSTSFTEGQSSLTTIDRLKIALQADGTNSKWTNADGEVLKRGINGGYTHSVSIVKRHKIDNLESLLNKSGLKYGKYICSEGKSNYNIQLEYDFDCKDLSWLLDKELNAGLCRDIVDEVVKWDGSIRKNKDAVLYCSTDKRNIDIIQGIAVLAGYKTHITKTTDNRKESYKDHYRLSIRKDVKEFIGCQSFNKEVKHYKGTVHCLTVPSGGLITRLDGKTFIAGNCLHYQFGVKMYNEYIQDKVPVQKLKNMIIEACENEKEFITMALPVRLIGMNDTLMKQYIEYVADTIMVDLGLERHYNSKQPFSFMNGIAIEAKANFFERKVSEYVKAEVGSINITEDF